MPRISTDNYDTVASWNGAQDLFIVEQPDGTKVATPAMVKQFMQAGDFTATGEIEDGHGNNLDSVADRLKRLNNIKIIDENLVIRFTGVSDVANRILCPIVFPFAFASNDYTLECSLIDLASVGRFTTGISVNTKDRSSALIILNTTSSAGATYCGAASIHISRTE